MLIVAREYSHDRLSPEELGYRVGYLGSAYQFGTMFSAYAFGVAADRYGRRPVLLTGILGTIAACLMFGLARSFATAMLARFLWGALNGNLGVVKTYVSEICDDSNMAKSFSLFGICGGLARLIGPAAGGFLYGSFGWLAKNKAFLPCLLAASTALVSWVLAFCLLKETLVRRPPPAARAAVVDASDATERLVVSDALVLADDADMVDDDTPTDGSGATKSAGEARAPRKPGDAQPEAPPDAPPAHQEQTPLREMLRTRSILIPTSLYGLCAFGSIIANELLPLHLLNDSEHGGFNFTSQNFGVLFLIVGPIQILGQMFYHRVAGKFGYRKLFIISNTMAALLYGGFPLVMGVTDASLAVKMVVLVLVWGAVRCVSLWAFTTTFVMTANGSLKRDRARANGIGQTFTSISRAIGPAAGSLMFAWSENNGLGWPFNYSFVWHLIGLIGLCITCWALRLPKSIDKKRE